MAETLVELVARISTDATELKKGLAVAERGTEQSSRRMADSLKKVGMAMNKKMDVSLEKIAKRKVAIEPTTSHERWLSIHLIKKNRDKRENNKANWVGVDAATQVTASLPEAFNSKKRPARNPDRLFLEIFLVSKKTK